VAVGLRDRGLAVLEVNLDHNRKRLTKYGHFLHQKSVKDIVELDRNLILVLTFSGPSEFFIIDLGTKEVSEMGPGFTKVGLCMAKMPGYDPIEFPYILCKELGNFSIFNPFNNYISEVYKDPRQQNQG
jgi:hypothetical protein